MSKFIAGGCSFTFGHELSDNPKGQHPSKNTWAHKLYKTRDFASEYVCTAKGGAGNSSIARRVYQAVANHDDIDCVVVMWTFVSRYDWAMQPHRLLENKRWASISPWDTDAGNEEAFRNLQGSETQQEQWRAREKDFIESGVKPFAELMYKYGANDYHETYLSWKSIIWLQNILEKRKLKYFFTLADNSLFYKETEIKYHNDNLLSNMYKEIDFTRWWSFGERRMGFNQWAWLNDYQRGTTHPLDDAHNDAVKLMLSAFKHKME